MRAAPKRASRTDESAGFGLRYRTPASGAARASRAPRTALACIALLLAAGATAARADAPADTLVRSGADDSLARRPAQTHPIEYLWVVRTSLTSRASIESVVERAKRMRAKGLLVQVVGRGDAWYRSDLLPRPEAIAGAELDPLGVLLPLAHEAGLEVHAWMNCMLVWSASNPPRDARHVLRAHPEWAARLADGRSLARLTARQRAQRKLEGVFLAPGHPGVRTWLANVAGELVSRYPVDGLHLDYIRLPSVATGFDGTTRARFALETGVDRARLDAVPWSERARVDSLWSAFQSRQIAAAVSEIRDSVERVRPGLPLSAAVLADTVSAKRVNAQPWWEWLRSGLLDRAFVMCYAPVVQTVLDQLLAYSEAPGVPARVVPGIAVYNTPPSVAAAKIRGARELGFTAVALYSYDSLFDRPGYWPALEELLRTAPAGARFTSEAP